MVKRSEVERLRQAIVQISTEEVLELDKKLPISGNQEHLSRRIAAMPPLMPSVTAKMDE
jgi:hypothetical protein